MLLIMGLVSLLCTVKGNNIAQLLIAGDSAHKVLWRGMAPTEVDPPHDPAGRIHDDEAGSAVCVF